MDNPSRSSSFDVRDSSIAKGLAIILLIFHHCFLKTVSQITDVKISFFPFSSDIGFMICQSFKLCVGMFVFITGYGLYKSISRTKFNLKSTAKWISTRYLKTVSGFWFVFVLAFAITTIIDLYPIRRYFSAGASALSGLFNILLDFLGIAHLFNKPMMIGTWWYMSALVVLILLVPLFYAISKKVGYLVCFAIAIIVPRFVDINLSLGKNPLSFACALLFGMLFAQYDLFSYQQKIVLFKNKRATNIVLLFVYAISFCLVVMFSAKLKKAGFYEFNFCIAPLFVICFCKRYLSNLKAISAVLNYIGKHSLNIFLIHTFYRFVYLTDFIYSFKYAIVIAPVLLGISLLTSVVIEWLKKLVRYNKLVDLMLKNIS